MRASGLAIQGILTAVRGRLWKTGANDTRGSVALMPLYPASLPVNNETRRTNAFQPGPKVLGDCEGNAQSRYTKRGQSAEVAVTVVLLPGAGTNPPDAANYTDVPGKN